MKKTKIIVPAMGLLLLGTAGSITGTVAWFSMNNSVAVTGMNVKTTVGSNILISATNTSDAGYSSGLDQAVAASILEPVSTVDGVSFFYHATDKNVAGDGHVSDTTFVAYAPGDTFDANYGLTSNNSAADCYGYADYSFYIKATNGAGDLRNLVMSTCNLTYKGGPVSVNAWRVAMFAKETATATTVADDSDMINTTNLKTILRLSTAHYFQVSSVEKAVAAVDAFGDLNAKIDDVANVAEGIPAAATKYYHIVVRLWLEGNDTSCNNDTFAALDGDFRLDLKFELKDDDGVAVLGSTGAAVIADPAGSLTAAVTLSDITTGNLTNGEPAATFQWYNAANNQPIENATNYNYTAAAACDVYCLVTTSRGNVYRTNTVHLGA